MGPRRNQPAVEKVHASPAVVLLAVAVDGSCAVTPVRVEPRDDRGQRTSSGSTYDDVKGLEALHSTLLVWSNRTSLL